uniref:Uncharacterized protein n=1 Tax=Arundo donax TaxID=35708 RepID=A0A0A9ENP6_ARUDO
MSASPRARVQDRGRGSGGHDEEKDEEWRRSSSVTVRVRLALVPNAHGTPPGTFCFSPPPPSIATATRAPR